MTEVLEEIIKGFKVLKKKYKNHPSTIEFIDRQIKTYEEIIKNVKTKRNNKKN